MSSREREAAACGLMCECGSISGIREISAYRSRVRRSVIMALFSRGWLTQPFLQFGHVKTNPRGKPFVAEPVTPKSGLQESAVRKCQWRQHLTRAAENRWPL